MVFIIVAAFVAVTSAHANEAAYARSTFSFATNVNYLSNKSSGEIKKSSYEQKIVGGKTASVSSFPYQGAVEEFADGDWSSVCGCSMVNHFWALSAAHCVEDDTNPGHYRLRFGTSRRLNGGEVYQVSRIIVHPKFNKSNYDYDVMLFRVQKYMTINSLTKPVKLRGVGDRPRVGSALMLSGFGAVHDDAFYMSSYLRTVQVTVSDWNQCGKTYSAKYQVPISDRMFCTYTAGKDACQGDSGGPAVDASGNQVGVISFGDGCAKKGWPGVYVHLGDAAINAFIKSYTDGQNS